MFGLYLIIKCGRKSGLTKKIVIVSNTSWSLFNFRLNLARFLKQSGYEVSLIAPFDDYSSKLEREFNFYDIKINSRGKNPLEDIKTFIDFYRLYKQIKPDFALHFTIKPNIYGSFAARILGIKTINNITGLGKIFMNKNLTTNIVRLLYKYSQTRVFKIFFQNKEDFNEFLKNKLVGEDKCDLLPGSGVDTKRFSPIKTYKNRNIFIFLLIARLMWDKGIGEYIGAAKNIKKIYNNVEFRLLGFLNDHDDDSLNINHIQKWSDEGLVNYLGVSNDVKLEISEADCVVLPSFYAEGTPRSLLESASMAKPIITTYNVGCKDVVDNGINGYLCEIKNVDDLTEKMEMILNLSEEDRIVMGQAGRKKMLLEFDETIVLNKYLSEIKAIA